MVTSEALRNLAYSVAQNLILSALFFLGTTFVNGKGVYSGEYCDTEVFRAECPEGEVIVLEKAKYGRMKIGRCVEIDLGHIGCFTDVLLTADKRCSGKRVCEIRIPDAEFESTRPCLKELKTYLEANYECVKVETVTSEYCKANDQLNVTSSSGYIASIVTSDTPHCEGVSHPWVIFGQPGQRINLTMYDFALDKSFSSTRSHQHPQHIQQQKQQQLQQQQQQDRQQPLQQRQQQGLSISTSAPVCSQYGLIEDNGAEAPTPICGSQKRVSDIYQSIGNVVKIWVTAGTAPTDLKRFAIHFTVVGCPDPLVPELAWFKRTADGKGVWGCYHGLQTSTVECDSNNEWKGNSVNCSMPATDSADRGRDAELDLSPQPFGKHKSSNRDEDGFFDKKVLILGIVAGTIGGVAFITLIICIISYRTRPRDEKRERDSVLLRKRQHEQDLLQSGGNGRTDCSGPLANSAAINSNVTEPLIGARQQRHPVKVNGNDYEHIWQSSGLILASSAPYEVERGPNLCQTFKPDIQAQLPPAPRVPDSPIRETIIGRDGCCANRGNQFDYYLYSTGRTALTDV